MAQITTLEALRERIPNPSPMTKVKVLPYIDGQGAEFVRRAPFLLLSTQNEDGSIEVSPKGDGPGFVHLEDERTLLIPDRQGNNLAFGLSNIIDRPKVGIIFLLPAAGETLRVSGDATLHDDPDICAKLSMRNQPAKLFIRVNVQHAYFHCARAILRSELWKPESWGPELKVSFGRIFREQKDLEEAVVGIIDRDVDKAYEHL
jgi:uncharacterized protein